MRIFLLVLCVFIFCTQRVYLESVSKSLIAKTNGDTFIVEGHFVTSSDIKVLMRNRIVSKIYVYVAHTFYVDTDLKLNGIEELQIFANTWNVTRSVTFDLSGLDGVNHESESASGKGSAGNPGNPGMSGGNFFGLAKKVIYIDFLTVILNGGNGGDGQDGTTSADVMVSFYEGEYKGDSGWFSSADLHNYYKRHFSDRGYEIDISSIDDSTSLYAVFLHNKEATFNITLHPRQCCGTTGIGGAGGLGGRGGNYNFINVGDENVNGPKLIVNDGLLGNAGKNAKACTSIALNLKVDTKLEKVVFIFLPLHHSFTSHFTIMNHVESNKCPSRLVRNDAVITPDLIPGKTKLIPAIIRYKGFLLKNMRDVSLKDITLRTYEAIDSNQDINEEYTLKEFAVEANELEKHYFELKKIINLLPFYQRLSSRIGNTTYEGLSGLQSILSLKSSDLKTDFGVIVNLEKFLEVPISIINQRGNYVGSKLNINDVELRNNIDQLRFYVCVNYILDEYFYVIESFKFSYFPFAAEYLKLYQLSNSLTTYKDMNEIVSITTNNLKSLNRTIDEIKSRNAVTVFNKLPSNYSDSAEAFYVWKNADIRRLFAGEKVIFFADIKQSKKQFNAIKFNTIDLVFRSSHQFINDKLNQILESFELNLNHTGLSAIRCNNKYYKVDSDYIHIVRRFNKNKLEDPYPRNLIYEMLRDNHPILSPYALWEFYLSVSSGDKRFAFHELKQFIEGVGDVEIELHGTGKYIRENATICNNDNLSKFYSFL